MELQYSLPWCKSSSPFGAWTHHADGHVKLNAQALAMAQWVESAFPFTESKTNGHLVVILNNRLAMMVGHVYLDSVEKHECMYQFIDFTTLVECIFFDLL